MNLNKVMGVMDYKTKIGFVLLGVVFLSQDVVCDSAICPYPSPVEYTTIQPKSLQTLETKSNFTSGDHVVYTCEEGDGRFGVIHIECLSTGEWSANNRGCADAMPLDDGSIGGITFASLTVFITVSSIVFANCRSTSDDG